MNLTKVWLRAFALAIACSTVTALASPAAQAAATFLIINGDGAGEGFNDPTAVSPVGGNSGTTIGAQRLIAFQAAANIWGALLTSSVTIRVQATFDPLTCNSTGAVLGSAGPSNTFRDFTGAPAASTWYVAAEANALSGAVQGSNTSDITAQFNSSIGTTCAFPSVWYYGLDGSPPGGQIDFVSVLVHELGHGLGFLTLVNLTTGAKALGFNDAFMLNLENHGATPPDYPSMTDAQRLAASTSTGNLHWVGANVMAASGVLTAGKVGTHVQMYAPNPQQGGSSVSHWDTALTPDQIMEPSYTGVHHIPGLELPAFKDIGWQVPLTVNVASHDFNGDGKSDILWRANTGDVALWLMNGAAVSSAASVGNVGSVWSIAGQRDFNGDGKADILWRASTGDVALWLMNGGAITQAISLGNVPASWSIAGTGDFNKDGKADILWRDSSGNVVIWLMNGGTVTSSTLVGNVPTSWSIAGSSGNGIVWRDTSGNTALWLMNGATISSSVSLGNIPTTWSVVGSADFDGDGNIDILWRDASGNSAIWLLNGSGAVTGSASLGNVPTNWSIAQTGDYNGDGKGDILWRDTSGNVVVWTMNGGTVLASTLVSNVSTVWSIQGAGAD